MTGKIEEVGEEDENEDKAGWKTKKEDRGILFIILQTLKESIKVLYKKKSRKKPLRILNSLMEAMLHHIFYKKYLS